MGKTRNLFKKIRNSKGNFHAKMGTTKDRNGMDLTEAEEVARIHRRTTQKRIFNDPDSHNGVIPHLEPDILECKVKWASGSITMNKVRRGDGIPVDDDAVKVLHSICQQIWKTQQWLQDWKRSVFIPVPKKGNDKKAQTTTQLHSSHMLAK